MFTLLETEAAIIIRFDWWAQFPTRLWEICKVFNPHGYIIAIETFLDLPAQELDVGYSLPLQTEAVNKGDPAQAIAFLLSDPIQDEVADVVRRGAATSLAVERKNQVDKNVSRGVKVKRGEFWVGDGVEAGIGFG